MTNPNATNEKIFDQIEKYGPVSALAIAESLKIDKKRVMAAISYMRHKKQINIQKKGEKNKREYFFNSTNPVFDKTNKEIAVMDKATKNTSYPAGTDRRQTGLDSIVDRCHHLIMALELCSSGTIMESFNLNEEQSRVLVNKVAAKYQDIDISFSVALKKEKVYGKSS